MCRCSTEPNALRPRVETVTEAVVVFVLAWLEKYKKKKNSCILVSWRLTTLAKLYVDVSNVF